MFCNAEPGAVDGAVEVVAAEDLGVWSWPEAGGFGWAVEIFLWDIC